MLLEAKPIVENKVKELKERVSNLKNKPKLVIIRVGDDKASERYVNNKIKKCNEVGIESLVIHLKESSTRLDVENVIMECNYNNSITGILLQLPLPKHLDEKYLTELIKPEKDVDGFTTRNMGKLVLGEKGNIACTPYGIIELLKYYNIPIAGQDVLIINRSNIVGKPLVHLFLEEDATVTIAHSKTKDLKEKIKNSDIIITAVGKANKFDSFNFYSSQTIIDVSINFDENGKICGDILKDDYDELLFMGCNITPVPGGVGPMTVISLLEQTIRIAERKEGSL